MGEERRVIREIPGTLEIQVISKSKGDRQAMVMVKRLDSATGKWTSTTRHLQRKIIESGKEVWLGWPPEERLFQKYAVYELPA